MPNYNRIKAAKAHPIGTIMPWTGSTSESALSPDAIPKGWIVCNGNQLKAKDYPLLAQILGNLYGPVVEPGQPFIGISNSYPNYNDDDVFNLPTLNQQALIDLESNLLTSQELAVIGTYVSLMVMIHKINQWQTYCHILMHSLQHKMNLNYQER